MTCREFEDRLEKLLDGQLSAAERREAERHRAECDRCRELTELARTAPSPAGGVSDPELTEAILRRTGGPACETARDRLPDLVDGKLGPTDTQLMSSHLSHCDGCRGLAEALAWVEEEMTAGKETTVEKLAAMTAPDLTASVLARTTGSTCETARDRIPERVDGVLGVLDAELVDVHLAHCGECDQLAKTLVWAAEELPAMAEVAPDAWFVQRVMQATAWKRPVTWADRAVGWWTALLKRPRLAWEAPYVGAMILLLLFGSPVSPMRDVPAQALAMVSANPVRAVEESPIPQMGTKLVAYTGQAWDVTGGKLWESTAPMRDVYNERLGRVWDQGTELGGDTAALWRALFAGDMDRSAEHLREIGRKLQAMWNELTGQTTETTKADTA